MERDLSGLVELRVPDHDHAIIYIDVVAIEADELASPSATHGELTSSPGLKPGACARQNRGQPGLLRAGSLHFIYSGDMPSHDTTTVRVRRPDSERLQTMAKSRQTTVVEVVHSAIEALERQEFLRALDDDFRRLREDPARWEAYQAERQEWDPLA